MGCPQVVQGRLARERPWAGHGHWLGQEEQVEQVEAGEGATVGWARPPGRLDPCGRSLALRESGLTLVRLVRIVHGGSPACLATGVRMLESRHGLALCTWALCTRLPQATRDRRGQSAGLMAAVRAGAGMDAQETGWLLTGQKAWMGLFEQSFSMSKPIQPTLSILLECVADLTVREFFSQQSTEGFYQSPLDT